MFPVTKLLLEEKETHFETHLETINIIGYFTYVCMYGMVWYGMVCIVLHCIVLYCMVCMNECNVMLCYVCMYVCNVCMHGWNGMVWYGMYVCMFVTLI